MPKQRLGTILCCPHCGKNDGEPVENYVVIGRYVAKADSCSWCNTRFQVTEMRDSDEFLIEKL
jgi:transcription elongation factor Elf1